MNNVKRRITNLEMAIIDENSEWLGVPRLLLMENAGKALATEISKRINVAGKKVVILAGLGNNGGDSFVAARHLALLGANVYVFLLGKSRDIRTDEARKNWETLKNMVLTVKTFEIKYVEELKNFEREIITADVVVDGMLGTGVRGELRDPYRSAVKIFNEATGLKVAVDIPTGLNPDTGQIHGTAVKADLTVTFHAPKRGLEDKREYTGDVVVADIGVPPEAEVLVGPGDLRAAVKIRRPDAKKGDFGRILIVGGSNLYTGAPALCAIAALRCGCDLSIIVAPESVAGSIRSFSPNIIVYAYPSKVFTLEALNTAIPLIEKSDAIVIGPGLGTSNEIFEACLKLFEIVRKKKKAVVVDADGLKALSTSPTALAGAKVVLTPHAGELKILTGLDITSLSLEERIGQIKKIAKQLGVTVLLKGHWDIVSDGNRVKVNMTGNPAMTVGGTGDVLSGLVATFLAWGNKPLTAASVAAFINGIAGDLVVREKGCHIVATDLLDKIPEVFKKFGVG